MSRRFAGLVALLGCLCAVPRAADSTGVWLDVPFVKQPKDGCGAASIAMVMQYWLNQKGKPATESATNVTRIQSELYVVGASGIYASAMARYFERHGFRTFSFRGEWKDLRQHLEKGRPLIVALKPSRSNAELHYVVVAGLDWKEGVLLLNDPARRKLLKLDRSGFEEQWNGAGRWILLALPQFDGRE